MQAYVADHRGLDFLHQVLACIVSTECFQDEGTARPDAYILQRHDCDSFLYHPQSLSKQGMEGKHEQSTDILLRYLQAILVREVNRAVKPDG